MYLYNGVLFGNNKEWNANICYNMNETWKSFAKLKKPDAKGVMRYHLHEMSRTDKSTERGSRLVVAGGWRKGKREWLFNGCRVSVWDDEIVLELVVMVTQHCECS